ncbi:MAG TPA: AAA family ATPase, partial [Nitrospira sp.]|nr:AAA family ATPase [Nitrospira sp.]
MASVRLRDFRSFEDAEIELDDVTTIVGANNVGKTNILDAIALLAPERPIDLAKDVRRHSQASTPVIEFTIAVKDPESVFPYNFTFPSELRVVKTHLSWDVLTVDGSGFLPRANGTRYWRNPTMNPITFRGAQIQPSAIVSDLALPVPGTGPGADGLEDFPEDQAIAAIGADILNRVRRALPLVSPKWDATETDFITEDNPIASILGDTQKTLPISLLLSGAAANDREIGDYAATLGRGIGSEVYTLCSRVSDSINDLFRRNWRFSPPILLRVTPESDSLTLYFDQGRTGVIEPAFTSDGLRWLVSFFIRLGMSDVRDRVLLFDQPGDQLYPGGQKDLILLIEQLGTQNQVVYTTHSPFMIGKSRLGRNVRIITKPTDSNGNQIGSSTIVNQINETDIRQSDLLTDALGFYWTDFVPVGDSNILMEGKLDAQIVINTERQKARRRGLSEIDFNRTVVRGLHGASHIQPEAVKLKNDDRRVVCVYDTDWKQSTPQLDKSEKLTLAEVDKGWVDIEDLLPPEWVERALASLNADDAELAYDADELGPPGAGRKLRTYLNSKREGLKDALEMSLIELVQREVEAD